MKISVYTIAKNESHNVHRWMESATEADYVVVTDTGSTDNTIELLRSLGATVHAAQIDCRKDGFDQARNLSLDQVPSDMDLCVCLDLDEPLSAGWRAALEKAWTPEYNLVQYPCVWEWEDEESIIPALFQPRTDRIHARHGFRWFGSIHEQCRSINGPPRVLSVDSFCGRHYQVGTRNYLTECTERLKNEPRNPYLCIQRGSEYLKLKDYQNAYHDYIQAMALLEPAPAEYEIKQLRAINCQSIARCLLNLYRPLDEVLPWLIRAVSECITRRESWTYLAEGWMAMGDWVSALAAAQRAMAITDRKLSPLLEEECWGDYPERMAQEAVRRINESAIGGNGHVGRNERLDLEATLREREK